MDTIKKIFPLSFNAHDFQSFLKTVIMYVVLDLVCGLAIGLLGKLPLIGLVFGLIGSVLGIYFAIGLLIAILVFLNIIK